MIIVVQQGSPDDGGGLPPPGPGPLPRGVRLTLTGVDGSEWDLTGGQPVTALAGVVGLGDAEVAHQWRDSAGVDGAAWLGSRLPARRVVLPVLLRASTSAALRTTDAAWSAALTPEDECTLVVTTPGGSQRRLRVRRDATPDSEGYDKDPLLVRRARYTPTFMAGDPLWRGDVVAATFRVVPPVSAYPQPGDPWVLRLSASDDTARASTSNPGHYPAWPLWRVTGPLTDGFEVGVGTARIVYGPVGAGSEVVVDTHPRQQTILTGSGADAWDGLVDREFAPVAPGVKVPVWVVLGGPAVGAKARVEITPGYRRAW